MSNPKTVKRGWMAALIVLSILIIDQIIKIWVKTHMTLHEQIEIFSWFKIVFIENNGMAYGMEIGSKLVLSIFRIVAIGLLGWYIAMQAKKHARWGYMICLSMIMAGAAGNIFDSMFYGLIFNASSEYYASYFVPFGTGYAPFLMGKVVDMFYFPLIHNSAGEVIFFRPVFNFADSCITCAVAAILLFYMKELNQDKGLEG